MKEIIYIQAGTLANYIGTHFWNTQEAYFTYDDYEEPVCNHDISFREGLTDTGEPTFSPRLLIFDRKANFGTLAKSNALWGAEEQNIADGEELPLWNGSVVEYRQDPIPKSQYQTRMDDESDDHDSSEGNKGGDVEEDSNIRYWSDFNRVSYVPRSVQKLPDYADWENMDGDWNAGRETFFRYNDDAGLMEGPLRLFLEECDSPQGLQVVNDSATAGSFVDSFLTSFRDEFLKLPSLVFSAFSDATPSQIAVDDHRGSKNVVNDALFLRSLTELSSMGIPIQSPLLNWPEDPWKAKMNLRRNSSYHTSSVLSAHIESSTLPLRLKGAQDDLASFSAQLNWRGMTNIGQLSGILPMTSSADFGGEVFDFSYASMVNQDPGQFARRDVSRGFSQSNLLAYDDWCNRSSLQMTFVASVHAPAYPIPTSFPPFFKPPYATPRRTRPGLLSPPSSISTFSSITTTSQTANLFSAYANFVENCVKRKTGIDVTIGLDVDEMKELSNDLWTLHDNYTDGQDLSQAVDGTDILGEDEE